MRKVERELKSVQPKNLPYRRQRPFSTNNPNNPSQFESNKLKSERRMKGEDNLNKTATTGFNEEEEISKLSLDVPPNSPTSKLASGSETGTLDRPPETPTTITSEAIVEVPKSETDKSVMVNLSLTGSNVEEKGRIQQMIGQIEQMREAKRRHESLGSNDTFEANYETIKGYRLPQAGKVKPTWCWMFKFKVYDFLKRPASIWAFFYHVMAFLLVASCLVVSVNPDVEHIHILEQIFGSKVEVLTLLEEVVLIWFTVEYLLRLWACNCRPQYQGWRGKWVFLKTPAHILDLLVIILSAIVAIWTQEGYLVFAFRAFRGFHRFFQVLQFLFVDRQLRPWRLFLSVLYDQREQLLIIFYLEIVIFSVMAYLGFLAEHQDNEDMHQIADFVWWSIVTLTTVGYGDKVPITWTGKAITATFILFGFCMFALPAGIIGAGLALKLDEVERGRQRRRRKNAAAGLIQAAYRCYRANVACSELGIFFHHQPVDIYKVRVYENLSLAFVANVQFHVAKRHFKIANRSVDIRSVFDSYRYGQMDVYGRLKQLNTALDIVISRMAAMERERLSSISQVSQALGLVPEIHSGSQSPAPSLLQTKAGTFVLNKEVTKSPKTVPTLRVYDLLHVPKWNRSLFTKVAQYPNLKDSDRKHSNIPYIDEKRISRRRNSR